jgi:hypothetical protein
LRGENCTYSRVSVKAKEERDYTGCEHRDLEESTAHSMTELKRIKLENITE